MVMPNLLNAVWVTVEPVDLAASVFDREAREPRRTVRRKTSVRLRAQNHPIRLASPEILAMGFTEDVRGWLTVRPVDLARKAYAPHHGDCIVKIGTLTKELYLLLNEDMGHHTDIGGAGLLRLYYGDRRPSAAKPAL